MLRAGIMEFVMTGIREKFVFAFTERTKCAGGLSIVQVE